MVDKKPIKVDVVKLPEPVVPPPPTEAEIKEQEILAQLAKEEADREARYIRNRSLMGEQAAPAIVKPIPPVVPVPIVGKGVADDGMFDTQIDEIMKKYPGFKGTIASDEIKTLKPESKIGVVMNLDKKNQPGSHWVSFYISTDDIDKSIEYYDPLGLPPTAEWKREIKKLINKIKPNDTLLKLKVNQVQHQDFTTNTCGLHALDFLRKRFSGQSFKMATGYKENGKKNQSERYENEIKKKFSSLM
jgi:hypothetical protein